MRSVTCRRGCNELGGTALLGRKHLQLPASGDRAFFSAAPGHRIADAEITEHAQGGCAVEVALFTDLLVKSIDLGKFDGNVATRVAAHLVSREWLQPPILLGGAAAKHQRATQNQRHNSAHVIPLARRVAGEYSAHRAVCPARGIGTPVHVGAARVPRPCGRGFLWSGVLRAPAGAPLPTTVVPIVARPATSFGTLGRTILVGDRP